MLERQQARAMARPLRYAMLAQLVASMLLLLGCKLWPAWGASAVALVVGQGLLAALVSACLRMPRWWLWIGAGFVPLAWLLQGLALAPWVWLAGFVLLMLVFWRTDASRVPLYMSNALTAQAVAELLPPQACQMIDLGCGDGSLLRYLARARPDCQFVGYEHAPLTWAWAWLRGRGLRNVSIRLGSFWPHSLQPYGLVYAFLSPAPMSQLWRKAQAELQPQAMLVSNSFPVPDTPPRIQCAVNDRRASILYGYQVGGTT